MAACPADEPKQLSVLSRLMSLDLDWRPAPERMPGDEELLATVANLPRLQVNRTGISALTAWTRRAKMAAREEIIVLQQTSQEAAL